jgi:putative flippase GtrA
MVLPQFLMFAFIGVAGFVVDSLVLTALHALGLDLLSGRVGSFLAAATFTWYCNRRLTFRTARKAPPAQQWLAFLAANALGGVINYATYAVLVLLVPLVAAHPVLGVAAGSLAGLVCNFTMSRTLVFRG